MPIHKMAVHFPVALLLASVIFDVLGALRRNEKLHHAGYYSLIGGVIGGVLAIVTGVFQERRMEERFARMRETMAAAGGFMDADAMRDQVMQTLSVHRLLALAVLAVFAVLLYWRLTQKGWAEGRAPGVYFLVAVLGAGILTSAAFFGGRLDERPGRPGLGGPEFRLDRPAGADRFPGSDRAGTAEGMPGGGAGAGGLR